jgi:HSP20 family protein
MTSLIRWEPFREMRRMHEMLDRLMDEAFLGTREGDGFFEGLIPVDVYETDDAIVVEASMPGVDPKHIDISISGDTLTIRGEVKREHEVKEADYFLRERRHQRFYRSLTLPTIFDADKANAEYENGILRLTLPKAEELKPKTITVKAKK